MKIDGATRSWLIFSAFAALAVFSSGILRATGHLGNGAIFATFAASISFLVYQAINLAGRKPHLNLTLAAETIVAFGIFSLIVSIAVVMLNVSEFLIKGSERELSIDEMRRFAWPFAEGLVAAAIAPFLATFFRHLESSTFTTEVDEPGLAAATSEAETLAAELKATATIFRSVNAEFVAAKDALLTHQVALERALGGAAKTTSMLSEALQTEAERLRVAVHRVQAEATGFADASQKGRVTLGELGTSLSQLNESARDSRQLLDALGKLIESVERFIKPDR